MIKTVNGQRTPRRAARNAFPGFFEFSPRFHQDDGAQCYMDILLFAPPSENLPFAIYCLHKLWQAVKATKAASKKLGEKLF